MPTVKISATDIQDGINIADLVVKSNIAPSKGQARTLIEQGGISINDEKITDTKYVISKETFDSQIILRKGKKVFIKVEVI